MRDQGTWARGGIEPSIDELLSDPIAIAVMQCDGLRSDDVRTTIDECRRRREAGLLWPHFGNLVFQGQLARMIARIGLDTEEAPLKRSTRNDLYATCLGCLNREACSRWLDSGEDAEHYREFCPNSLMFDRLLRVSLWRRA